MLAAERLQEISKMMQDQGVVKVELLAKHFGVSEMTIRRDLEKLEKDGAIARCYGGAVLKSETIHDLNFQDRQVLHLEQKRRIAEHCLQYVREGSTIYLDAGSTVLELARMIVSIPGLTAVTNDVIIASYLINTDVSVIVVGGTMQKGLGCIHGYIAESVLSGLSIDAAFASGLTIDKNFDLFAATESKVYFRRKLLENANKAYLMVDSSKFYKQSIYRTHSVSSYTAVVTDKVPNSEELRFIHEKAINLITV